MMLGGQVDFDKAVADRNELERMIRIGTGRADLQVGHIRLLFTFRYGSFLVHENGFNLITILSTGPRRAWQRCSARVVCSLLEVCRPRDAVTMADSLYAPSQMRLMSIPHSAGKASTLASRMPYVVQPIYTAVLSIDPGCPDEPRLEAFPRCERSCSALSS